MKNIVAIGVLMSGVAFGGVALWAFRAATSPEALAKAGFSQDGDIVKDPGEKAKIARMFAVFFGAGSALLLMCGAAMLRSEASKEQELLAHLPSSRARAANSSLREAQQASALVPSLPMAPSYGVARARGFFSGLNPFAFIYISPEVARYSGKAWILVTVVFFGALGASFSFWTMPPMAYLFAGMIGIVLLMAFVPIVRTLLALRKLEIQVTDWTSRARPGDLVTMTFLITGRTHCPVTAIKILLAGVRQEKDGKKTRREYLHGAEVLVEQSRTFHPGRTEQFKAGLVLPDDAPPTAKNFDPKVCWALGVVAELPGWPDLEVAREVEVESRPGTAPLR